MAKKSGTSGIEHNKPAPEKEACPLPTGIPGRGFLIQLTNV